MRHVLDLDSLHKPPGVERLGPPSVRLKHLAQVPNEGLAVGWVIALVAELVPSHHATALLAIDLA